MNAVFSELERLDAALSEIECLLKDLDIDDVGLEELGEVSQRIAGASLKLDELRDTLREIETDVEDL